MAPEVWYNDTLVLRDFAGAAVEAGIAEDKSEVYEKPYKFNDEYEVWKDAGFPSPEDTNWDDFTNNLTVEDDGEGK